MLHYNTNWKTRLSKLGSLSDVNKLEWLLQLAEKCKALYTIPSIVYCLCYARIKYIVQ